MGNPGQSSGATPPKKIKYLPKVPSKKETTVVTSKTEPSEIANALGSKLRSSAKQVEAGQRPERMPKMEPKRKDSAPMQVAFGNVDRSVAGRKFPVFQGEARYQEGTTSRVKKYKDPWNYDSYYPTILPLRSPHAGDPEILDEAEFGKAHLRYDEASLHDEDSQEAHINSAKDLGLKDNGSGQMLLFQFPPSLPLGRRHEEGKVNDARRVPIKGKDITARTAAAQEKKSKLEELPAGFMGKILVYSSGAVKMKLGDVIFDVSPGTDCMFAQDVMAINTQEKRCCVLGELSEKRAIVTPNLDFMLSSISGLD